jgi:hypothetical protein
MFGIRSNGRAEPSWNSGVRPTPGRLAVTLGRTRALLDDAGRGCTRAREASTGAANVVGVVARLLV